MTSSGNQHRLSLEDIALLNDEICALARAGVPLQLGLRSTAGGLRRQAAAVVDTLAAHVAAGHTLDQAFPTQRPLHEALGGLTDVPLMRAGGVAVQLTACWVPDAAIGGPHGSRQPLLKKLQMVDYLHRELEGAAGEQAALATCAGDIEAARVAGKD